MGNCNELPGARLLPILMISVARVPSLPGVGLCSSRGPSQASGSTSIQFSWLHLHDLGGMLVSGYVTNSWNQASTCTPFWVLKLLPWCFTQNLCSSTPVSLRPFNCLSPVPNFQFTSGGIPATDQDSLLDPTLVWCLWTLSSTRPC